MTEKEQGANGCMNKSSTSTESSAGTTQTRSGPVRYELIDKDGEPLVHNTFETVAKAAEMAKFMWPDQEQDEDRTGKGWDVQIAGLRDPE